MCGIVGFFSKNLKNNEEICNKMLEAIHHRGPDDSGIWKDDLGMVFGHKRLSILDVSPLGHQPMLSNCGRYMIVYNGEVYNYKQIRKELEGYNFKFKGNSDTETILAAISFWGIEKAVERFIGMFAFAIWDKQERKLFLVRDRAGIKPLYYGFQGASFIFGSEVSAFRQHPDFKNDIDINALDTFFRMSYIPTPYSIYKNIFKLEPGTILSLSIDDLGEGKLSQPTKYWSAEKIYSNAASNPFEGSYDEAINQLELLLKDSVLLRMISDVPLGAFLSGGVDSSLIVALMQSLSEQKIKTFSIGFNEPKYNEANYAKEVAQFSNTNHTELYITQNDMLDFIPHINKYMDEPLGDSSFIPTYFVSKLAREHVTVSLSGDGGDELFSGYPKYNDAINGWQKIGKMNLTIRKFLSVLIDNTPDSILNFAASPFQKSIKNMFKEDSLDIKLHKISEILTEKDFFSFFAKCNSAFRKDKSFVLNSERIETFHSLPINKMDLFNYMSMVDIKTYLVDDILTKVDRASMAVSLESRVPILDHRIIEFAASLPTEYKVKNGVNKRILKDLLYRYVPQNIIDRPKKGFGIPLGDWIKGDLREVFEVTLLQDKLKNQGYLDYTFVRKIWQEHTSHKRNWAAVLWNIFIFQNWLENR